MDILDNETIVSEIIQRIRIKYGFDVAGGGRSQDDIHLSDVVYCITKTFYRRVLPNTKPTDREALTFAIGLGLEKVLLEIPDDNNRPGNRYVDGIHINPDYQLLIEETLGELKTTRLYFNKDGEPTKGWPLGWIKQMAGYSYAYRQRSYMLAVFQIIGAAMIGKEFRFSQEELDEFWNSYVLPRKRELQNAYKAQLPPEPFKFNEEWECNDCAFRMACQLGASTGVGYVEQHEKWSIPESMMPPPPPPKPNKSDKLVAKRS